MKRRDFIALVGTVAIGCGWNFSPPCSPLRPKKRSNSH